MFELFAVEAAPLSLRHY